MAASYRYDAYGNTVTASGSLAGANVYRFSSKEFLVNSGLSYYGYRFYDPNLQRWLNRDPIGEEGGINLYGFIGNNPANAIDPTGEAAAIGIGAGIGTAVCPGVGTGVGAVVGAIVTGVGIAIIACTPHSPPKPRCGDCTPAEHAALQAAVNAACKSGPSKCTGSQDLATLQANLAKNAACAAGRDAINNKCFKGGDAGHREAADNARKAAAKCAALIAQKQANQPQNPDPQPPNPQPLQP
jgi:RHS repeat-associated protein